MAITKTHLYTISFAPDELMKVLIKMDKMQDSIYPQVSKSIVGNVKGVSTMDNNNPYNEPLDELYHIFDRISLDKEIIDQAYEEVSLEHVNEVISSVNEEVDTIDQVKQNIIKEKEENEEALEVLNHIRKTKMTLDDIYDTKYVTIRFGKVPLNDYQKIKFYKDYQFIWRKLSETKHYVWIVYVGLTKEIGEIDNILYSMNFEETKLPDFAHGGINEAISELDTEVQAMNKYIDETDDKLNQVKEKNKDMLITLFNKVYNLKHLFDQCKYVVNFSAKEAIYAFSTLDEKAINEVFKDVDGHKIMELPVDIYHDKGITSPVIIKNNFIFKPFQNILSAHVGDTFDPTFIIGLVSMLVSCLLIGDFGAGAVVFVLGLLMHKTETMGALLQRIGASIFVGGLLSGEAFYSIEVYKPIFEFTTDVVLRFILAAMIVVVTIILMMLIKKATRKKSKL